MADGRHFKNGFIALYRPGIIRLRWNLVCGLKFWFKDGHMLIYKKIYEIQNSGQPPYWKSYFGYISTSYTSDWRGIWYVQVEPCSDTCHVTKIAIFENSRCRTAAILKMVSSLYLSRGSSVFNKIWYATANFGSKDGHVTKHQNFANSKWRMAAILKIVFGYIWTTYWPINVK